MEYTNNTHPRSKTGEESCIPSKSNINNQDTKLRWSETDYISMVSYSGGVTLCLWTWHPVFHKSEHSAKQQDPRRITTHEIVDLLIHARKLLPGHAPMINWTLNHTTDARTVSRPIHRTNRRVTFPSFRGTFVGHLLRSLMTKTLFDL